MRKEVAFIYLVKESSAITRLCDYHLYNSPLEVKMIYMIDEDRILLLEKFVSESPDYMENLCCDIYKITYREQTIAGA